MGNINCLVMTIKLNSNLYNWFFVYNQIVRTTETEEAKKLKLKCMTSMKSWYNKHSSLSLKCKSIPGQFQKNIFLDFYFSNKLTGPNINIKMRCWYIISLFHSNNPMDVGGGTNQKTKHKSHFVLEFQTKSKPFFW